MFFEEYSPRHHEAFQRYRRAACRVEGLDDQDLEALLEDWNFTEEVTKERRRRLTERPSADAFCAPTPVGVTLAQHVRHLAAMAPAITVKVIDDTSRAARFVGKGMCFGATREIIVREVEESASYAIALHELGHLREAKQSGEQLEREVAAWQWAYDAALEWTAASEIQLDLGLIPHIEASSNARAIVAAETFMKAPRPEKRRP